jgi:hypothetical protein
MAGGDHPPGFNPLEVNAPAADSPINQVKWGHNFQPVRLQGVASIDPASW